jgi:glutamate transport system substrate-binding protein
MRTSRLIAGLGIAAAAILTLSACNSGSPTGGTGDGTGDESGELFEIATDVDLTGSPTFDAITERGGINIGIREDQPGLGYLDPTTGERVGFDVDIARWVAASLGYGEDDITYTAVPSANREQAIINGDIDYMVGSYSITPARQEQISFAGPYFVTGQGLLVAADNEDIAGPDDLAGQTVCSVTGSTSIQRIRDEHPDAETVEFDTYSQCIEAINSGQVQAVTTDEAILLGYAAQAPDELKIVGEPFSEERYGIGLALGDTALQEYINTMLTDGGDTWQAIFDRNLGEAGVDGVQPEVDPVS